MSQGSVITFQKTPDDIRTPLTRTLKLYCGLNDTSSAGPDNAVIGRRDVTNTPADVHYLTSIVVMRNNGDHVATVTQFTGAQALMDQDNLKVVGDVSGKAGVRGYVELTWDWPTPSQAGNYTCEINAMNDAGHTVVFGESLKVDTVTPTLGDLISHVRDMEKENAMKLTQMQALLNQQGHIENGTLACGNSNNWNQTDGHHHKLNFVTHQFATPYAKPPIVHLGVTYFSNIVGRNQNTYYLVDVVDVNEHGFTMKCLTYSGLRIPTMNVDWVSFSG